VRSQRGSIDFELPEAEIKVDSLGEVLSIQNRARLDAHRLIEEFMIVANESVTEWMMEKKWPFVYRIHDEPSLQSLEKFQSLAATVGIQVSLEKSQSPKIMADIIRRLEGHPAQTLLNTALLRSMKQAIYSSTHSIHYGLASPGYTHFTSPIRRYPDLVVHRLLRMVIQTQALKEKKLKPHQREKLEEELNEICEHCSYRERLAADAERESIRLKQVRVMIKKLGEEFDGKIVGMTANGVFVQIQDPYVEGMVPVESMGDDFYQFDEDRMVFFGRRKKKVLKIGDSMRVQAVRADLEKRQIDFSTVK
jgi:ribonuclease R